jgi:L-threonylcarbamoyladenylate synthase
MKIIKRDLKKAVKAIKEGKVLVCPTDTVYGLLCDFNNKKAVERLYRIKNRPKRKPVPIFVKDIKTAKRLARINPEQEKYLKSIWPGKVTIVLKRTCLGGRGKIKTYGVDKKTIALRIPNYKLVLDLLEKTNKLLIGTSANIAGKPALTKIKEVIKQFEGKGHRPDLIIDAGDLPQNKPSKVLDLTVWPPKILRS